MRNNPFLAVPLTLMVLVAGCTGTEEAGESDNEGPTKPPPGPNATVPVAQFLECATFGMGMEVPHETTREHVPAAFTIVGATSGTAHLVVGIYKCGRTVNETSVLGPATLFVGLAFVQTTDTSWSPDRARDRYVLDVVTDNDALREALGQFGLDVSLGVFEHQTSPDAGGNRVESWSIRSESLEIKAELSEHDLSPQPTSWKGQLWFAGASRLGERPSYPRFTLEDNSTFAAEQIGPLIASGNSRLAASIGTKATATEGSWHSSGSFSLQYDGSWPK